MNHTVAVSPPLRNSIADHRSWLQMRDQCVRDPGAFHGAMAKRNLAWFLPHHGPAGLWATLDAEQGRWNAWDGGSGAAVNVDLPTSFDPWDTAFNGDSPPNWRWFDGGFTNAGFNEVDRHVLAGQGSEAALIFEGDRWNMSENGGRGGPVDSYSVSRKRLMLESAKCSLALTALGLRPGDRIALNMPSIPEQIYWTEGAKRLGVIYTPVFGGFSDKTLSDRIADAGARVVITADGSYRNAQAVPFKASYTDPALDNFMPVAAALDLLREALDDQTLEVAREPRDRIIDEVRALLDGEVTVERSDVMRGVGRALAALGRTAALDAKQAAQLRTALASRLVASPSRVDAVVVVRHTAQANMVWNADRDRWSHDLTDAAASTLLEAARGIGVEVGSEADLLALDDADFVRAVWAASRPLPVEAEYPSFVIYTSGSTGKPKGVVHVHGGYSAGVAATMPVAFDARPGDVMYVVADPGWITGQSYLIAASLLTRVTTVVCEGSPVFPHAGRFASIIERYGVSVFKAGSPS